ncbi:MAG: hypothetical protein VX185_00345 [Pseudomonadota bacterium]|nr:hypothetical protein [Pseudomonadota bacterium]
MKPNRHDFILEVKSRLNKIKTTDKKDLLITPEALPLSLISPRVHAMNKKYNIDTRISWEQVGLLQESRRSYLSYLKKNGNDKSLFDKNNKDRFLNIYNFWSDVELFNGTHPKLTQSDINKLQACFTPYFSLSKNNAKRSKVRSKCEDSFRELVNSNSKLTEVFNDLCQNKCDHIDQLIKDHGLEPKQYVKWVNLVRKEAIKDKKNIALFHAMDSRFFSPATGDGSIESAHISVAIVSEKGDYLRIVPDLPGSEFIASQEDNKANIYNSNFDRFDGHNNELVDCKAENDKTPAHLRNYDHDVNRSRTGCYPQRSEYGCASLAIAYAADLLKNNAQTLREYSLLGHQTSFKKSFLKRGNDASNPQGYIFIPPHPLRHAQSPTHVNVMRNFMAADDTSVAFEVGFKKVSQLTIAGLEAQGMTFTKLDGTRLKAADLKDFRSRWVKEHDRIQNLPKTKAMILTSSLTTRRGKPVQTVSQSLALAYLAHKDITKAKKAQKILQ